MVQVDLQDAGQIKHVGVFIDGDEYLVEQRLKVVPLNPVHDEPLEWGDHDEVDVGYGNVEVDQTSVVQLWRGRKDSKLCSKVIVHTLCRKGSI